MTTTSRCRRTSSSTTWRSEPPSSSSTSRRRIGARRRLRHRCSRRANRRRRLRGHRNRPLRGDALVLEADAHRSRRRSLPGLTLPFEDDQFDLVYCVAVMHHIAEAPDVRQTLARWSESRTPEARPLTMASPIGTENRSARARTSRRSHPPTRWRVRARQRGAPRPRPPRSTGRAAPGPACRAARTVARYVVGSPIAQPSSETLTASALNGESDERILRVGEL